MLKTNETITWLFSSTVVYQGLNFFPYRPTQKILIKSLEMKIFFVRPNIILNHESNWWRCPHGSVTASDGLTLFSVIFGSCPSLEGTWISITGEFKWKSIIVNWNHDGFPSFYHLWAVMDFHPKSLVMDIHLSHFSIVLQVAYRWYRPPIASIALQWLGSIQIMSDLIWIYRLLNNP